MQFATGDRAVAETAMRGAIWTRCLVPPKLRDSSGAAELIKASVAVNEAVAHRILATELRQVVWGATLLYLDELAVFHGTAADQVTREMKYLAAKMAILQEDRSQGKTKAEKTDGSCHPPEILTKPLQGKGYLFKRAPGPQGRSARGAGLRRGLSGGCRRGRGQGRPLPDAHLPTRPPERGTGSSGSSLAGGAARPAPCKGH